MIILVVYIGARVQGQQGANMMMGFGNNPPGAVPAPHVSPATEKYDRPKEAHSHSSSNSSQVCSMTFQNLGVSEKEEEVFVFAIVRR